MSARLRLALIAGLALAACADGAPRAPTGVGPAGPPPPSAASARAPIELARPDAEPPDAAVVAPAPPPSAPPAPAVPGPDIVDLGPFEVLTWGQALERAERRITSANADAELAALRQEIEGRP
jgi:hypothetical protein